MRGISVNLRPQNHPLESFPPTIIHWLFLRTEQTFSVTLLKLKSYQAPECCWPEFEIRPVELLLRQNQFWRWIPTDWRHYLLPCLTLWNVTGLLILGDASPLLLYVGHACLHVETSDKKFNVHQCRYLARTSNMYLNTLYVPSEGECKTWSSFELISTQLDWFLQSSRRLTNSVWYHPFIWQ